MNLSVTVVSVLAIAVLIFGNALFVAAEFSLTALDRSTVEANARSGRRRDRLIQRAQHRLSFQLSGAQLGISITTLATGYLTEPMVADLPHPWFDAIGDTRPGGRRVHGIPGAGDRHVGVDGVRRAGPEVSRGRPPAADRPRRRGPAIAVLAAAHPGHPIDKRGSELDRAPTGHRAGRGAAVGPLSAGAAVAGADLGPQRLPGPRHRIAGAAIAAVRHPDRRGTDDAAVEDRGAADRRHRRRPDRGRRRVRVLPIPARRRRPRRDRRHRARQAGVPNSARRTRAHAAHHRRTSPSRWCRRRWTAMR